MQNMKRFLSHVNPADVLKSLVTMVGFHVDSKTLEIQVGQATSGSNPGVFEAPIIFLQPPALPLGDRMLAKKSHGCAEEIRKGSKHSKQTEGMETLRYVSTSSDV
eukprot:Lankesteria_metandrocarpae@DN10408_c0_g1_i1.p1